MSSMVEPQTKTIYTTHEVSRLLHVNPRSVINWIEQNLLPSYRTPGGHRRIRREDLLAFLRKHQIPTPASLVDGKFSVLIVDDEDEIIKIVRTYFERQGGYEVSSASDGITALIEVGAVGALLVAHLRRGALGPRHAERVAARAALGEEHRTLVNGAGALGHADLLAAACDEPAGEGKQSENGRDTTTKHGGRGSYEKIRCGHAPPCTRSAPGRSRRAGRQWLRRAVGGGRAIGPDHPDRAR